MKSVRVSSHLRRKPLQAQKPRPRYKDVKVKVIEFQGGLARNIITRPDGMQLIVSTIDNKARWRSPPSSQRELGEALGAFDEMMGVGSFETAVWVEKFKGYDMPSEVFPVVIVAEYTERDLALAGHQLIVNRVKKGRLDFTDIRSGDAMVDREGFEEWFHREGLEGFKWRV